MFIGQSLDQILVNASNSIGRTKKRMNTTNMITEVRLYLGLL